MSKKPLTEGHVLRKGEIVSFFSELEVTSDKIELISDILLYDFMNSRLNAIKAITKVLLTIKELGKILE